MDRLAYLILGIIAEASIKHAYIAAWGITDKLEIGANELQNTKYPQTEYEEALRILIANGLVEELPELDYRYRLIKGRIGYAYEKMPENSQEGNTPDEI